MAAGILLWSWVRSLASCDLNFLTSKTRSLSLSHCAKEWFVCLVSLNSSSWTVSMFLWLPLHSCTHRPGLYFLKHSNPFVVHWVVYKKVYSVHNGRDLMTQWKMVEITNKNRVNSAHLMTKFLFLIKWYRDKWCFPICLMDLPHTLSTQFKWPENTELVIPYIRSYIQNCFRWGQFLLSLRIDRNVYKWFLRWFSFFCDPDNSWAHGFHNFLILGL